MELRIGEIISDLRHEKDLTQEQFANMVSVSVPAVSKWETGQSCPDIMLLPVMAEIFDVSIDRLMNFSLMERSKNLPNILNQLNDFVRTSDYESGLPIALEAIKKYPNNFDIIWYTAIFLQSRGTSCSSPSKEQDLYDSIDYYEAALKLCSDKNRIVSIKYSIACNYKSLKKYQKALDTLQALDDSRRFAIGIADLKYSIGDIEEAKRLLQQKLYSDTIDLGELCRILKNSYNHENNKSMALETQKLLCGVWELLTWETPNYYDELVSGAYCDLAKLHLENKEFEEMWKALKSAVYHATRFSKNPSCKTTDVKFMELLEGYSVSHCPSHNASYYLLTDLKKDFCEFSNDIKYKDMLSELEKTAATKKEMGILK